MTGGVIVFFILALVVIITIAKTALVVPQPNFFGALEDPHALTDWAHARGALVIAEIALAIVLLTGAGLMLQSFAKLTAVEPGFDTTRVMTFSVALPPAPYRGRAQAFFDQLNDRLAALCAKYPTRFAGLASFAPHSPKRAAREMDPRVSGSSHSPSPMKAHTRAALVSSILRWWRYLLKRAW